MERVILPHDGTGSNDVRDFFHDFVAIGRLERDRTTGLCRHEVPIFCPNAVFIGKPRKPLPDRRLNYLRPKL